jgi:hypothetical protein
MTALPLKRDQPWAEGGHDRDLGDVAETKAGEHGEVADFLE